MHPVVEFQTTKVDVSNKDHNPINPIYRKSLLLWLQNKAGGVVDIPEPDYEDWGWYADITWKGRGYMLGASSDDGETWFFQIDKHRTFIEKLLGKEKIQKVRKFGDISSLYLSQKMILKILN